MNEDLYAEVCYNNEQFKNFGQNAQKLSFYINLLQIYQALSYLLSILSLILSFNRREGHVLPTMAIATSFEPR